METMLMNRASKTHQYFLSILFVCVVSLCCYLISSVIGYRVVALILLVTVSLIAMFFDILPVLLAAVLSALIWDFFFIPPKYTFFIGANEDTLMLSMYFVIALLNAVLTYKIRQIEKVAREKEEKAKAVKLYDVLLSSLSHELRTPIATIIGAADNLLAGNDKLTEENKTSLVSDISIAAIRLNQQVDNLLNMSRLEAGFIQLKRDWCDVNELIYSVVNGFEENLNSHHIEIEIPEKMPLFKLDFGLMHQVLKNLIGNAIIYTEPGTVIRIKADYLKEISGHFIIGTGNFQPRRDQINSFLFIEISDNGKGFPPEEIHQVFNKFYRLKDSRAGGTGLGLSIAKGFVEAHNGTIHLSNIPEGGARFMIKIPAETSFLKETEK